MNVAKRKITVAGITVTVREITVNDIRAWLINAESASNDIVGQLIIDGVSLDEICRCSDLTEKQAGKLTPSELCEITQLCKELNPYFFALRERLKFAPATLT
jgi:hypothetical protein